MPTVPPILIVDESTRLRRWRLEDAQALYDAVMSGQEHIARWMSWADGTYTLDAAREFLAACDRGYPTGQLDWAIEVDGAPVGSIGVPRSEPAHGEYEIGYWLAEPYTGRGIMTRTAATVVQWLIDTKQAHRVQIAALGGNRPSRAVAERLGFTEEGTFRRARYHRGTWHDLVWYAITSDEWAARPSFARPLPPGGGA
ncbi:MAG: GNAT family N-acetyltransferase [Dehalococcoidia bacterium]|nr:GNAT family N-acetyltransferase [Dehalococcoidia bacterium]